jgi:hypothetical protein
MAPLLRHRLTTALGWLLFALAYYLPVLPLQGNTTPPDERVQQLLQQACTRPPSNGICCARGHSVGAAGPLRDGPQRAGPRPVQALSPTLRPGTCLAW